MADKAKAGERLTQYLLGVGSSAEREQLESEYFTDDEVFEQMLIAEEELIDEFVRDELSDKERRQVKEHLLKSPYAGERVKFARTLNSGLADAQRIKTTHNVSSERPRAGFLESLLSRWSWRYAAVATALVVAVSFGWLLVERARLREELQGLQAEREKLTAQNQELRTSVQAERTRADQLTAQVAANKIPVESKPQGIQGPGALTAKNQKPGRAGSRPGREPHIVSSDAIAGSSFTAAVSSNVPSGSVVFDIASGSVRSGGGIQLRVPRKAKFIVLRVILDIDSASETYRAFIETAAGDPVWGVDSFKLPRSVKAGEKLLLPPVPVTDLPPNDYILFVEDQRPDSTFDKLASYTFHVLKQ